ncbi:MAG: FecR domain-containing protein, partial [Candidatus Omnitrophota bacterium]
LVLVFVIAAGLIAWSQFAPRSYNPLAFEILGFEGDVQVYDLHSRSWRAPKRGEDFVTSQKLKTGADGMINFQVENELHLRLKENSEILNEESRVVGKREVYKLRLSQGVLLGATTRQFERKQKDDKAILKILTRDYVANIHGAIFRVQASTQPGQQSKVGVLRGFVEVSKPSPFFRTEGIRIRGLEETNVVGGVIQPATKVTPEAWGLMKESYELLEKTAVMEAEQIDLAKMAGSFFNVVFDHGTFFTPKIGYAGREFFKDQDSGQVYLETEYDVFPAGSFCGVYFKTRDFDISKYAGFSFEIRRKADEGAPDSFFIELKSKGNVARRFAPKTFEKSWKTVEFDFHAKKPLIVNEMVFVFTNARVGEAKKGIIEFRNVKLIPLPVVPATVPKAVAPVTTAVAVVSPTQPVVNQTVSVPVAPQAPAAPAESNTLSVPKEIPLS